MSEPMPRGAHLKLVEAPSPPEEPPGVRVRLCGFRVVPVRLLLQQRCFFFLLVLGCELGRKDWYHEGLGLVCADVKDCTGFCQTLKKQGVFGGYVVYTALC